MPNRFREDRKEKKENSTYQQITKIISVLMGLIYVCFGAFILITPSDTFALPATFKIILGVILILYGLLRFVRAYQQHFKSRK